MSALEKYITTLAAYRDSTVPETAHYAALEASAAFGRHVAALLDVETPVPGVTEGSIRDDGRPVGVLKTVDDTAPDFTVNAGRGHFGVGSAVIPGYERAGT